MVKNELKSHIDSLRYKIERRLYRGGTYRQQGPLCNTNRNSDIKISEDPRKATCDSCLRVWLWLMWERGNLKVIDEKTM